MGDEPDSTEGHLQSGLFGRQHASPVRGTTKSTVRYSTFPQTEPPPDHTEEVVALFRKYERLISTIDLDKGLTSDEVLRHFAGDLRSLGFEVEAGKQKLQKINRPVFFGENGKPTLNYQIDAYQPDWRAGLEVEAGRGWMGNAVYRDLVQAAVMVGVDVLFLAVANTYKFRTKGRQVISRDYANTVNLAGALFGHSRIHLPYRLVVIGY